MRSPLALRTALRTAPAALLLLTLCASSLEAQTADQLVKQGREQLAKQTPAGLRKADELFTKALAKKPDHPAANVLKTGTSFALINSNPSTIGTLELLGVGTHDTNPFDPEYSIPIDTKGRPAPAKTAATKALKDWNNRVALPQIDAALARLAKVRNKKFLLVLSKRETGERSLRIDYGDVHAVRFGLLLAKAALALQDTYNSDASFYTAYQLIRRGELDLETFLKRYPLLLTRAGADQRALSKRYFLAAESTYRLLASPALRARNPKLAEFHFIAASNRDSEKNFRQALAALRKSFQTPQKLDGVTINLGRAVTAKKTPRSLLGRVRGNTILPDTWPDPTLAGVLPSGGRTFLQKQAEMLRRSLTKAYPEPVITSSNSIGGRVRKPLRYRIETNLKPRGFTTTPLPAGLSLNKTTGLISGKPTKAGTYSVRITANTSAGPARRILEIRIKR